MMRVAMGVGRMALRSCGNTFAALALAGLVACGGGGGGGVEDAASGPRPRIGLATEALAFSAVAAGAGASERTVVVSNAGGGTLGGLRVGPIVYGPGASGWLATAALSGTTAPAVLTLRPEAGALAAGSYSASVPIVAAGADNSPQQVSVTLTVEAPPPMRLSGRALFDLVPHHAATGALRYEATVSRPIRGATVEVVAAASGATLATGATDAAGAWALTIAPPQAVRVRVRAEMKRALAGGAGGSGGSGAAWDFSVRDNTAGDAVHVLESAAVAPAAAATLDLLAGSGWDGSGYGAARAAAPFAILDVAYEAMHKVLAASPAAVFPALRLFWSASNRPVAGDVASGAIGRTAYSFDGGHRIDVLGAAGIDTDEYDRSVIAREWARYFQRAFSRDDSSGGGHAAGDRLDMRVAFSEGWSKAWAAMVAGAPVLTDSSGPGQQAGQVVDVSAGPASHRGWFNEDSVAWLLWHAYAHPGIGAGPIVAVMTAWPDNLRADGALAALHSFAHHLKRAVPAQAAAIDSLLASQQVGAADALGSTESNAGGVALALPVYKNHAAPLGTAQSHCVTDAAASASGRDNKLGARAFIRLPIAAAGTYVVRAASTHGGAGTDPDFRLLRPDGSASEHATAAPAVESATLTLAAGMHLLVLEDRALTGGAGAGAGAPASTRCFDVHVRDASLPLPPLGVSSVTPAQGAVAVPRGASLSATYSENLLTAPTFSVTAAGVPVAGTVAVNGATATFTPQALLPAATSIAVLVAAGAGTSGATPASSTAWSFTTMAPPRIALSRGALDFAGTAGGTDPAAQAVNITNTGGGRLSELRIGAITYGAGASGWLAGTTLDASAAPAVLSVRPAIGLLAPGPYTATLAIVAAEADNSPQTVNVRLVVGASSSQVTIAGVAQFESVPADAPSRRLLYAATVARPIRAATVEIVAAATGSVLATGTTSASGAYALALPSPPAASSVFVRVRAQMVKSAADGGGSWDFSVRDNTSADALYSLVSPAFAVAPGFIARNLLAGSGWDGAAYTAARSAAPFAILDVVYDSMQKVRSAAPDAAFPVLRLLWSINNRPVAGDWASGAIGSAFYVFDGSHRIYLRGAADTDTDEYDRAVIAHEWGHYFQQAFSRSDSVGGAHSFDDRLDMRTAFGEGWGSAWAGMALDSSHFMDTYGVGQQDGYAIDLSASPDADRGWFNELSVAHLLWQLHADPAIGFAPIFAVMSSLPERLRADGALAAMHSFAHYLKEAVPTQAAAIDALLASQQVSASDELGRSEGNDGGVPLALPVYKMHPAALGVARNYCVSDAAASFTGEDNKLGAHVAIQVSLGSSGMRTIHVASTNGATASNPDFLLIGADGSRSNHRGAGSSETATTFLPAGKHVLIVSDFELTEHPVHAAVNSGTRCFDVTIQ